MSRHLIHAEQYLDDEDRSVLRMICDCGTVTDVVFDDPNHLGELAVTCDGCLTSYWITRVRVDEEIR